MRCLLSTTILKTGGNKVATVANKQIRDAAKEAGICLWQVAEKLGVNDGNFSRKLRRELPPAEREKVLNIIRELSQEKQEGE